MQQTKIIILDPSLLQEQQKLSLELGCIIGYKYIVITSTEKVDGLIKVIEL